MKKYIALILAFVMVCTLALSGCNNNQTDPTNAPTNGQNDATAAPTEPADEVHLWDGIYEETTIGLKTFYRFNEDGTYYGWFFDGGVSEAGTYEVVDKEMNYRPEGLPEGESDSAEASETAAQVIITTSYQGKVTEMAYANDTLCDVTIGGMAGYRFMHHNASYEYVPENEEVALVVYTYYADNKAGNSLTLYHNKTFVDYTGEVGVEGTWEKDSEFGFTLTGEDGTVTMLAIDGHDAIYGEVILKDQIIDEGAPQVINSYRVEETQIGIEIPVGVRIDCYSDATCQLVVEIAMIGAEIVADAGTYELDELMYTPTFHFASLGDIVSEPDFAGATETGLPVNITLQGSVDAIDADGNVTPMTFDCVLAGTATATAVPTPAAPTLITRWEVLQIWTEGLPMPVDFYIDCYSDGSCMAYIYVSFVDSNIPLDFGTYSINEAYGFDLVFGVAGNVTGQPDYATATADNLTINTAFKGTYELPQEDGSVLTLTVDTVASGPAFLVTE